MSRSEWWTLVILGGFCDFLLVMILVYLRFIWDIQCKQWSMMWREAFNDDIEKLHMGDSSGGQSGLRPRDLHGRPGLDIQESIRDAAERGPRIR